MSDPTTAAPSEEELRQYLESLRAAEPVEVVVQAFGILATAAEVKLGRPDARILIDGMTAVVDATAPRLPESIVARMRESVTQLQMAQVQAEQQAAGEQEGAQAAPGPAAQPSSGPAAEQPSGQPSGQQQESMTNRLWIPGRDQR